MKCDDVLQACCARVPQGNDLDSIAAPLIGGRGIALPWRRPLGEELLSKARSSSDGQWAFDWALRIGGHIVLCLQLLMVADVLMGFSLPGTLHMAHGREEPDAFASVHALAMWIAIPPVPSLRGARSASGPQSTAVSGILARQPTQCRGRPWQIRTPCGSSGPGCEHRLARQTDLSHPSLACFARLLVEACSSRWHTRG